MKLIFSIIVNFATIIPGQYDTYLYHDWSAYKRDMK